MTRYEPIGGGYSYASLRVGLVVRNPEGREIYVQPGDDEAAMRADIEALDEWSEDPADPKRGIITDMILARVFVVLKSGEPQKSAIINQAVMDFPPFRRARNRCLLKKASKSAEIPIFIYISIYNSNIYIYREKKIYRGVFFYIYISSGANGIFV